jgi:hypothetical protein
MEYLSKIIQQITTTKPNNKTQQSITQTQQIAQGNKTIKQTQPKSKTKQTQPKFQSQLE